VPYEKWTVGADSLDDTMNNAKLLGPFPRTGLPLGGKTLIIGGKTITFPGDEGANVSMMDVAKTLREAPGMTAKLRPYGQAGAPDMIQSFLSLSHEGGFTIGAGGTANELLGLPTDKDFKGKKPIDQSNVRGVARTNTGDYDVYLGGEGGKWGSSDEDEE